MELPGTWTDCAADAVGAPPAGLAWWDGVSSALARSPGDARRMHRQLVVIQERRGYWAAQLRGRLADRPVRWRETRGLSDLLEAVRGSPCPIVVFDLGPRLPETLERLITLSSLAPTALILALDAEDRPEVRRLARECGATLLRSGFVPPPEVAALVDRWLCLARQREAESGRSGLYQEEPDPSDPLTLLGP